MSRQRLVKGIATAGLLATLLLCPRISEADKFLLIVDAGEVDNKIMKGLRGQLKGAGHVGIAASTSLEDTALMLGCDPTQDGCLDQVIETSDWDGLVILNGTAGPLVVRRGGVTTSEDLSDGPKAWNQALAKALGFGGTPAEPATTENPGTDVAVTETIPERVPEKVPETGEANHAGETPPDPEPVPGPAIGGSMEQGSGQGFSLGAVRRRTWVVMGAGAAAAGLGVIFYGVAAGKQDDVDKHPTESVADLEALRELEDSGSNFALAGNIFFIGGSAAILTGVGLMLWDAKRDRKESKMAVVPSVSHDGVGVSLQWSSL